MSEKFSEPSSPDWDIDGPDDDSNPYYLPLSEAEWVEYRRVVLAWEPSGRTTSGASEGDE